MPSWVKSSFFVRSPRTMSSAACGREGKHTRTHTHLRAHLHIRVSAVQWRQPTPSAHWPNHDSTGWAGQWAGNDPPSSTARLLILRPSARKERRVYKSTDVSYAFDLGQTKSAWRLIRTKRPDYGTVE